MCLTRLMSPQFQHIRGTSGYRQLSKIDGFLVALSPQRTFSTARSRRRAPACIDSLLKDLGINCHASSGEVTGCTRVEHLGSCWTPD